MPSPEWLSWGFWAKDTEGLNHLALIIAGAIGIPLLAIRTFAANRSARAALEQAKAANQSAAAAFELAKTAANRHDEQTTADRERRITESFAKAVEQLGSDKLETRLGAIYTLERIAQESEREYWPIMETLTAFVREHAPWTPRQALANPFVQLQISGGEREETEGESTPTKKKDATKQTSLTQPSPEFRPATDIRPATDMQAVLTVLGRRDETTRKRDKGRPLDLDATDLRGADLRRAHLEGANLRRAHLDNADLRGVRLEGANLRGAHLEGASLVGAHLEKASLVEAHVQGATLWGAHLEDTDLQGAHIEGIVFLAAKGLTQWQVDQAHGNKKTGLPDGLSRPWHWSAPDAPDNAK